MAEAELKTKIGQAQKTAPKFYKIVMEDVEGIPPGGQFFSLNGRNWYLKGGHTYIIPLGLKGILDNAVESYPVQNPDTQQVIGYRNKLRFPYRVLGQADDADDLRDD